MNVKQRVFLYGNSVILGSISASLQRCSQFDVTTLGLLEVIKSEFN
jgi:hypothetical protein